MQPNTEYCYSLTAVSTTAESEKSDETCAKTLQGEGFSEIMLNDFIVYPNPATSEVKIISGMNGETEINICDMTGSCVKNVHCSDIRNATINISDIEKGIYLININGKIRKLIVR